MEDNAQKVDCLLTIKALLQQHPSYQSLPACVQTDAERQELLAYVLQLIASFEQLEQILWLGAKQAPHSAQWTAPEINDGVPFAPYELLHTVLQGTSQTPTLLTLHPTLQSFLQELPIVTEQLLTQKQGPDETLAVYRLRRRFLHGLAHSDLPYLLDTYTHDMAALCIAVEQRSTDWLELSRLLFTTPARWCQRTKAIAS